MAPKKNLHEANVNEKNFMRLKIPPSLPLP